MLKTRTNNQIRSPQLRLIDEDGKQLGIMPTAEALRIATERELDLVEISPQANPPVAKLINFDKFRYHQKKLEQQQKKKIKKVEVKTVRLSIRISQHDMDTKAKQSDKFLEDGHRVKVDLMMRGREQAFADLAMTVVNKFILMITKGEVEVPAKRQGNTISTVIKKKA